MPAFRDLSGQVFGKWSVVSWDHKRSATQFWKCVCQCGTKAIVNGDSLKKGLSASCGCAAKDWCRTHGMEHTATYTCWAAMKQRCQNKKNKFYDRYGGRGIKVCDQWQTFDGFFADMGVKPAGLQIERKDNDGDYEPGNCIWATRKAQIRNRSTTVKVGSESVGAIAERTGIPVKRLRERKKAGISGEELLSTRKLNRWR